MNQIVRNASWLRTLQRVVSSQGRGLVFPHESRPPPALVLVIATERSKESGTEIWLAGLKITFHCKVQVSPHLTSREAVQGQSKLEARGAVSGMPDERQQMSV